MKPIIGPNDKRTKITITLPFDAAGDAAFDENGKLIGTPLELTVPRFDFMPRPMFRQMMKTIDSISNPVEGEEDKAAQDRNYEVILAMLEPFIDEQVHDLLADMPIGVLEQISTDWNEGSSIPLGQLRSSTNSSKTTKGRSTTTSDSSGAESDSETSDTT